MSLELRGRAASFGNQVERLEGVSEGQYPISEGVAFAVAAFAVSAAVAIYLVFHLHIIAGGAYARMEQGQFIVYGGIFHLAAVSFYSSPLYDLMVIPFALLSRLWPQFLSLGVAGNAITAIFAAVGAFHMNRLLWRFGLSRSARILWTALFLLSPLVLIYNANGMSDGAEAALMIASVDGLVDYLQNRRLTALARGGAWLAAAFMMRYEAVPVGALMVAGLVLAVWREDGSPKRAVGAGVAFSFLPLAAGIIFMALNWMIKHNPFWFAEAKVSNASQVASGSYNFPQVVAAEHNLSQSAYQVLHFTDNYWPFLIVATVIVLLQFRKRPSPIGLPLVLASFGVPLFQFVLLYEHTSADWVRFFIYDIPFGILMTAFVVSQLPLRNTRTYVALGCCLVLLSADYLSWTELHSPEWGNGSTGYLSAVGQRISPFEQVEGRSVRAASVFTNMYPSFARWKRIADYINARPGKTFVVYQYVEPWIKRPSQVIYDSQSDFQAILLNPRGRADYFVAAPPSGLGAETDPIEVAYPGLWGGAVPWAKLVYQFPGTGDRVFRVLSTAP